MDPLPDTPETSADDPTRRTILAAGAAPLLAGGLAGLVSACAPRPAADLDDRKPVFFDRAEWRFINAWVDRLIPADATGPGAIEAGVPGFIDRQLAGPYGAGAYWYMSGPFRSDTPATLGYQAPHTPRALYRQAIAGLEADVQRRRGASFSTLDAPARDAYLREVEAGEVALEGVSSAAFFALAWRNTREGYFSDPIHGGNRGMAAWRMIGFPGARADFTDWMDKPGAPYTLGPVSIGGRRLG